MAATFLYSSYLKISIYITINRSILGLIAKFCRVINLDYIFVWNIILASLFRKPFVVFCSSIFFFVEMLGVWGAGMLEGLNGGRAVAFP